MFPNFNSMIVPISCWEWTRRVRGTNIREIRVSTNGHRGHHELSSWPVDCSTLQHKCAYVVIAVYSDGRKNDVYSKGCMQLKVDLIRVEKLVYFEQNILFVYDVTMFVYVI